MTWFCPIVLWSRIIKNKDVFTGPLARPFACLLAHLGSLTPELVEKLFLLFFFSVLDHSGLMEYFGLTLFSSVCYCISLYLRVFVIGGPES